MQMRSLVLRLRLSAAWRETVPCYGRACLTGTLVTAGCGGAITPASRPASQSPSPPGPTRDFARIEGELFSALNTARTKPSTVAAWLEDLSRDFTGTRLKRPISLSDNIDYAPMSSGRDVIESLVVDDGVPDRGHRRNIYEPSARFVGIACGPHPKCTAACVIVQAGGVTAR